MKSLLHVAGLCALTFFLLTGCDQLSGSGESILIVDLAAVAKATGQEQRMQQQSQAAITELNAQLQARAAELEAGLEQQRQEAGDSPSDAQAQALQESTLAAQQEYAQLQAGAQQQVQQLEVNMVLEYREQMEPIVETIARSRNASAVLLSDTSVFWIDPAADITDEVIAAIRAEGSLEEASEEAEQLEEAMDAQDAAMDLPEAAGAE